ncbi:glycosyltransferase family 4 protein [Mucilaginibacter sp. UR6-11]|uniref:glycosyltransferase family 4 protein n=1 Tax=Mucilaginibacter sp. UR6-11 TaxID=1435644 RepID=UPI001E2F3393|nr:glycosyltransferase family 4 protein [Mucilaginibacter sp. UR6-11]MCC8424858.1 glycosyltransferase family 4 protein [Mucilaginibacter sp. UR6-11]
MKLLYITNGINGAGGLERVLSIKTKYLAEDYRYDITILTLNELVHAPFYEFSDKVKLVSINVGGNLVSYIKSYISGINKLVKDFAPDVISVCDDGLKGFFIPTILKKNTVIIYERHVSKEIEMQEGFSLLKQISVKIKWLLMNKLARNFSKFIVLTNGNIKEWPGLDNISIIANPLSFYPSQSSLLKNKKIIAVGKHGYQKGFDILLRSWQLVQQLHPDWQLNIYGKIEPAAKLQQLANELKVNETVFFYPPEKNIQDKYLQSSIYVMSSRYEGFGMVLIEAMACGVPCVSFDCNYGPSDIIQNEIDGYVVENSNERALANSINELIAKPDLREAMGEKAKQNVKRFLSETIVKQWDDLFNKLVNENNF